MSSSPGASLPSPGIPGAFRKATLLFLGIAYLFVGAINLLHILAYGGRGVFPGFGADLPVRLGFAARGLESVCLCLAPLFLGRRLRPSAVFVGYFLTFALITLVIFVWPIFPLSVAAGPGLAALQQTADCLPGVILLGALALLWRRREEFDPEVLRRLLAAIALAVGSELALAVFAGASDQAGVVGHLLKICSLLLIYQALIETGIRRPYHLLFRNVKLGEAMVRQERDFADRLMETAQVMVVVLDRQGRIVRLNPAGERLTGYTLAQVKGRLFWKVFPAPEAVDATAEAFYHLTAGDFHQAYESDWVAKDGAHRLIAWSATAHVGEDGVVSHVIGTGIDLTDRQDGGNSPPTAPGRTSASGSGSKGADPGTGGHQGGTGQLNRCGVSRSQVPAPLDQRLLRSPGEQRRPPARL